MFFPRTLIVVELSTLPHHATQLTTSLNTTSKHNVAF